MQKDFFVTNTSKLSCFVKSVQEDVAKRLIDQQVAPLMENIPNHFLVNGLFSPDTLSFGCICDVKHLR